MNDPAIINSNCTWVKTTNTSLDNHKTEVIYTFECFEKNPVYGWLTLSIVFCLPGLVNFSLRKKIFTDDEKMFGLKKIAIQCCIILVLIMALPLFPLQIFIVKLLTLLTEGNEMNKISNYMSLFESVLESSSQLTVQLYIIFTSRNRQPSTTQILGLFGSIVFIVKAHLQQHFSETPNAPLKKKLILFPQKLCYVAFICMGGALILLIFQFGAVLYISTHTVIRLSLLSTRKVGNFKAELISALIRDAKNARYGYVLFCPDVRTSKALLILLYHAQTLCPSDRNMNHEHYAVRSTLLPLLHMTKHLRIFILQNISLF